LNLRPPDPSTSESAFLPPFALACSAAWTLALTCTDTPPVGLLPYVASCSVLRTYAPQSASKVRPPSNLVLGTLSWQEATQPVPGGLHSPLRGQGLSTALSQVDRHMESRSSSAEPGRPHPPLTPRAKGSPRSAGYGGGLARTSPGSRPAARRSSRRSRASAARSNPGSSRFEHFPDRVRVVGFHRAGGPVEARIRGWRLH